MVAVRLSAALISVRCVRSYPLSILCPMAPAAPVVPAPHAAAAARPARVSPCAPQAPSPGAAASSGRLQRLITAFAPGGAAAKPAAASTVPKAATVVDPATAPAAPELLLPRSAPEAPLLPPPDHPVLELLRQRVREGSVPGRRSDGFKLGLVVEGGGMRGIVTGGQRRAGRTGAAEPPRRPGAWCAAAEGALRQAAGRGAAGAACAALRSRCPSSRLGSRRFQAAPVRHPQPSPLPLCCPATHHDAPCSTPHSPGHPTQNNTSPGAMLMALLGCDTREAFDAVYGASAGAINSTYFLTGARARTARPRLHAWSARFAPCPAWRGLRGPPTPLGASNRVFCCPQPKITWTRNASCTHAHMCTAHTHVHRTHTTAIPPGPS
jgi:hypothetical protein